MNRRKFLAGGLAAGAATMSGLRFAEAAPGLTPYPTLLINLRGGMDPAMNLVATPNGSFGNVVIANRMSGTSAIKTTASGIRYFTGTVAAAGKAQFEAHLGDVALLRSFKAGGTHSFTVAPWYGPFTGDKTVPKKPWGNYVASAFRAAGVYVPKPCVVVYPTRETTTGILDWVAYGNISPDPACAAERALSYTGFFDSLSNTGLPAFERQSPSYALAGALDGRTYSGAQPDIRNKFDSSNKNADAAMKAAFGGPAWPPPANVMTALGLVPADFAKPLTETVVRKFAAHLAFGFQAIAKNLSHVVAITNYGFEGSNDGWDSHDNNYSQQIGAGANFWSNIGKLVALMKATPSPIVAGKTMFETTNIWIQSEMGRTAQADLSVPGNGNTPDGTGHWPHGSATFLGGRFKRGIAIGGYSPKWESKPINPVTGAEGGAVMGFNNVIATVIKAAGADPTGHTGAAVPIDALLDMSA